MKRVLKYLSVTLLVLFSFYYTNVVSKIFIEKSELMKQIKNYHLEYEKNYVNAVIVDNYIIPGINGIQIDDQSSYYVMKENNQFDKDLLVLKETTPYDSYYSHLDLIINKGNPAKNGVSIIVENNTDIINYALKKKIVINRLVDKKTVLNNSFYEQINHDFLHYEQVEKILDHNNINTNICIINDNEFDFCKSNGKYLVKPSIYLENQSKMLNENITAGDIIFLDNNYSLSKFKLLLLKVRTLNLRLMYLNELISESR